MAYDYTIKGNPLLSGFQGGQAIGQGLKQAFSTNPAVKEAMAQIAQGADPQMVLQQLGSQNPDAAQMLAEQLMSQYKTQAAPLAIEESQQRVEAMRGANQRTQQFDQLVQESDGNITPDFWVKATLIDENRANTMLDAMNKAGPQAMQWLAGQLSMAVGADLSRDGGMQAQTQLLKDAAKQINQVNPMLASGIEEIAGIQDPTRRTQMLASTVRMIGEGGFLPGAGRPKIKASYKVDGGTRFVYENGQVQFVPATEEEVSASETEAQRKAREAADKRRAELEVEGEILPDIEARKAEAKARAEAEVQREGKQEGMQVQLRQFNTALDNLEQSLLETTTGPIVGRFPAVSSEAQTAEGARAIMAPILKDITRSAGEGVFTDKDQELLLMQLPSRTDSPEAIQNKIRMIRQSMEAKLANPETPMEQIIQQQTSVGTNNSQQGGQISTQGMTPQQRADYYLSIAKGN